jgi:putative pyruvate formate lyase activating enzyme
VAAAGTVGGGWAEDYRACELCPRRCRVNRSAGRRGYCGAGDAVEVYRHGAHLGEEPPISGTRGSGTVFFSRCTLRCLYCQNYRWSQEGEGRAGSVEELAGLFRELAERGCHNLNWVSPTPWLPGIVAAWERARAGGALPPVVYNTSGFERVETIERLSGVVDVFLTDLRYATAEVAAEGSDCAAYPEAARLALRAMCALTGPLDVDGEGVARRGTICRVLVLPGRPQEAVDSLRWMAHNLGTDAVAVSVMAQYTPTYRATDAAPWNRRVSAGEYGRVADEVERLGFETGWMQELQPEPPPELAGFRMKPGRG